MAGTDAEDVATGKRFRGAYLVEQAEYTEVLVKREAAILLPLGITKPVADSLTDLKTKVRTAMGDRDLAAADSHSATTSQNQALSKAKSWLRKAILMGKNSYFGDKQAIGEFTKGGETGNSVPKLEAKLESVLKLLRGGAAITSKYGATTAFLKEGDDLLAAVSAKDVDQEHKKSDLPKATRDFYVNKAQLYYVLKRINTAGAIAHMDDSEAKAKYNLEILHRRGTPKKAKEPVGAGTA